MPDGLSIGHHIDPAVISKALPQIPQQNWCLYFGPGSAVATQLSFKTFFDADHTVAGWFMPQYARGGHGAIFASTGSEQYFVGQGDYRDGDALISPYDLAPGVSLKEGSAVLTIFAGSAKRIYLAPSWKAGVWQHIAVVRKASILSLFLNGTKLEPVLVQDNKNAAGKIVSKTVTSTSELSVPASINSADMGELRLGRSKHPTLTAYAQAYGLLDDVAVFDHALNRAELTALFTKKRLAGYEAGMVAGWGFDTPVAGNLLPRKLAGNTVKEDIGGNLTVSDDRNSAADRLWMDFPLVYVKNTPIVKFPFPAGEEWKVVQGYCNPTSSHNGDSAAFCYDLTKASGSSGNKPVYACEAGSVYEYLRNGTVTTREPNRVVTYNEGLDFAMSYLHFAGNSLTDSVVDDDPVPADPDQMVTLWPNASRGIYTGTKIGLVGPIANHLHLGAKEVVVDPNFGLFLELSKNQIPVAFKDIEIKSPGDENFHGILGLCVPKEGDIIRAV